MRGCALLVAGSVVGLFALSVSACHTDSPDVSSETASQTATLGEACSVERPCQPEWLCLDGVCVERPWPPSGELSPPTVADVFVPEDPVDVIAESDGDVTTAAETDSQFDLLHDTGADDASGDVGPVPDVLQPPLLDTASNDGGSDDVLVSVDVWGADVFVPDSADIDVSVVDASQDAALVDDTSSGGGPLDAGPQPSQDVPVTPSPPKKVVFLVAEDDWEAGVAPPTLVPEEGQGWVTQLDAPAAGTMVGFQAMMGAPFGTPACGLYRAALWFPFGELEFNAYPSWISEVPVAMHPSDEPFVWLLYDPPDVPEGPVRFGLIVDQLCGTAAVRPALLSDDSGDSEGSWLYAPTSGGAALVPGAALDVGGRWVLRALIEVQLQ